MIGQIVGGIIRHVLTVLGGGLVTQGLLESEQLTAGVGAILTLLGIAWSVWQKSKKRTVPGGEFNSRAEVRKPARKYRFPKTGGYYQWPASVAALVGLAALLLIAVMISHCPARASREMHWSEMMERRDAMLAQQEIDITWAEVIDRRPFLVRLLDSLRVVPVALDLSDGSDSSDFMRVRWKISGGTDF